MIPEATGPPPLRVVVAAAHQLVRGGLRALLADTAALTIVGYAGGLADLERTVATASADVAILDWNPAASRHFITAPAAAALPVIAIGDPTASSVTLALRAGMRGYLPRDTTAEELVGAIRAVVGGLVVLHPLAARALTGDRGALTASERAGLPEEQLTPRELDILQQLASGLPNKAIAARLTISEHTVKFHVAAILAKLGAGSRTEAVATAARRGLLVL